MTTHLIFHIASVVFDDEGIFFSLWLLVERIFLVDVVELMQKILVAATRKAEKN